MCGVQVGERKAGVEAAEVLGQSSVAHLDEAQAQLQDGEHMLHPRANLGVDAIGFTLLGPEVEFGAPTSADAVFGLLSVLGQYRALALIRLIAPHPGPHRQIFVRGEENRCLQNDASQPSRRVPLSPPGPTG